ACSIASTVTGLSVVLVGANDVHLFRDAAVGPITPVDAAILATFCRAVITADTRRLTLLEWCAGGFIFSAMLGTAYAYSNDALTPLLRIASYLGLGLAAGRAMRAGDRARLMRTLVGAEVG